MTSAAGTSRMHAGLTAGRTVTVTFGEKTLFAYAYGAARPHLTGLRTLTGARLPTNVTWSPPHAGPGPAAHTTLTELSATARTATISHHLRWAAVGEWRSLTTSVTGDDTWLLLFENTVTNTSGRPLLLDGPSLSLPAITAAPAARAEWRAAHDRGFTLVVVDDTANLQHPPRWSAGLDPAPFGAGDARLDPDHTISFRYAVVLAPAAADAPALAALGRDALAGAPAGPIPAARSHLCHGERTRRGPIHRTRTRVLSQQCGSRGGTPPPA